MPTLNSARFVNSTNALTDRDQRTQIIQDIIAVNTQVNTNTSNISTLSGNVTTLQGNEVFTTKVTIPSGDILNSFTTPVNLIATPGAGKYILPISVQQSMVFNNAAYATNITSYIGWGTDILASDGFHFVTSIDQAVNVTLKNVVSIGELNPAADRYYVANEPLQFQTLVGNPDTGDSDIDFIITYKIITI